MCCLLIVLCLPSVPCVALPCFLSGKCIQKITCFLLFDRASALQIKGCCQARGVTIQKLWSHIAYSSFFLPARGMVCPCTGYNRKGTLSGVHDTSPTAELTRGMPQPDLKCFETKHCNGLHSTFALTMI